MIAPPGASVAAQASAMPSVSDMPTAQSKSGRIRSPLRKSRALRIMVNVLRVSSSSGQKTEPSPKPSLRAPPELNEHRAPQHSGGRERNSNACADRRSRRSTNDAPARLGLGEGCSGEEKPTRQHQRSHPTLLKTHPAETVDWSIATNHNVSVSSSDF